MSKKKKMKKMPNYSFCSTEYGGEECAGHGGYCGSSLSIWNPVAAVISLLMKIANRQARSEKKASQTHACTATISRYAKRGQRDDVDGRRHQSVQPGHPFS